MLNEFILTNIDTIKNGDLIMCDNGDIKTVCNKDIKNGFMGITIFGDSYNLGSKPVKKITMYDGGVI